MRFKVGPIDASPKQLVARFPAVIWQQQHSRSTYFTGDSSIHLWKNRYWSVCKKIQEIRHQRKAIFTHLTNICTSEMYNLYNNTEIIMIVVIDDLQFKNIIWNCPYMVNITLMQDKAGIFLVSYSWSSPFLWKAIWYNLSAEMKL